ncbi:MAG: EamA family transporter, partial [Flavobacteriia bacterium]|nr:EamA family transporter [Flavobacteriia bacterium]
GDLFLVGNSLSYAIYLILVKPLMQKYPPLLVITWVFAFGSLFLWMFPPLYGDLAATRLNLIPYEVWLKIVFVIVGVTFLTYLFTVFGLKYVSSTVASVFIYVQPVFVMLFSWLFAKIGWAEDYTTAINITTLSLMLVVFLGVYLTTRRT